VKRLSIVLAAVFLSVSLCHAQTLAQIRTEIRRAIRDNPSSSSFYKYSDAVLLDFINEAQRETVNLTGLAAKTTQYVLTAGVTYYSLPTDLLLINQVYFTDSRLNTLGLEQKSQRSLYDNNPMWERNSGTPISYWVSNSTLPQNQQSAPLRISYIPIPTRTSTGTVTIWYDATVSDLSADADVPFDNRSNLYPYHMGLAYHVIYRIKLIQGQVEEAAAYQKLYISSVDVMKGRFSQMPDYRPGVSVPGIK
jgi:hypothetical protein